MSNSPPSACAALKTAPVNAAVARHSTFDGFTLAWAALAAAAIPFVWIVIHVWYSLPEMNDRFLIPLASAWVIKRNLPRWRAAAIRPNRVGLLAVAIGALAAPPAWFLLVQVGPRVILLWWVFAGFVLAALGLVLAQFGWPRMRLVLFPVAFCFLALPAPDRIQAPIQLRLKEYTTSATAAMLPAIGIPAERRGNVLVLPSGKLGVVDACSGVRSVSALTAIAILVAYLRGFSVLRGALLVAIMMAIVVVSNSLRVIITGILQEKVGPQFAEGWPHEVLGYSVILVGLALIVAASSLIAPPKKSGDVSDPQLHKLPAWPARGGWLASLIILLAIGAGVWCEQLRDRHRTETDLSALPHTIDGWEGRDEPVLESVSDMLKCDQIVHRVYSGRLGQEIELYAMFWATPASTAHMHHPDICMPCQGWEIESQRVRPIRFDPNRPAIPVSIRTYTQDNKRQLVFYWSQAGNQILPDGPEDPSHISDYAWIRQMLTAQTSMQRTSRLSVRIDMELHGAPEHREEVVADVCASMAREIYRLCPWALPEE